MVASDPIAVYREHRFESRREFRLFPTEIQVAAHDNLAGNHAEVTIPLSTLRPKADRLWLRHRAFQRLLLITAIATVVSVVCFVGPFSVPVRVFGTILSGIFAFMCGVVTACCWRRIEWAQFVNDSGVAVLQIAVIGYERGQFPQFLNELIRAIEAAREKPVAKASADYDAAGRVSVDCYLRPFSHALLEE